MVDSTKSTLARNCLTELSSWLFHWIVNSWLLHCLHTVKELSAVNCFTELSMYLTILQWNQVYTSSWSLAMVGPQAHASGIFFPLLAHLALKFVTTQSTSVRFTCNQRLYYRNDTTCFLSSWILTSAIDWPVASCTLDAIRSNKHLVCVCMYEDMLENMQDDEASGSMSASNLSRSWFIHRLGSLV